MSEYSSNEKLIFNLAISVGEFLLKNGGEVYRVQNTIERILDSYNIKEHHVIVLSTGIFASIEDNEKDISYSVVRNVPLGNTDLGAIASVNQLSRELCSHSCSPEEGCLRLKNFEQVPLIKVHWRILSCAMSCSAICTMFGGSLLDAFIDFFLGALLQFFLISTTKKGVSKFIKSIIGSGIITFCSILIVYLLPIVNADKIIIGGIIPLLPGVAITISIRDFFGGDYLSGSIHLIDALLSAMCIAIGVGGIIKLYVMFI